MVSAVDFIFFMWWIPQILHLMLLSLLVLLAFQAVILLIFVLNSVAELIEVLHGQIMICPTSGKALHLLFALFDFHK